MKKNIGRIIICCLLFSLNAAGHDFDSIGKERPQGRVATFMEKLHKVQLYLDSAAMRKVDPRYIEVPAKPWRVIMRYKANTVDVEYNSVFGVPEGDNRVDWKLCFEPPTATSVGIWVGYRGTGISFSKSLTKNAGRYFSFSSTGAKYGINFRYRRFNTKTTTFSSKSYIDGELFNESNITEDLNSPVWIRSVYVNAYYVFNGHRYSQAAAYNQSVIQRRSAGSFLAGATWYQSSFDYSDIQNAMFMEIAKNVGRVKVHQANLGFGYGYNFVPCRGLVINAMAMPTISVYNRVKSYQYDFNYVLPLYETSTEGYGTWNAETKTWANGKVHKPLSYVENPEQYPDDAECWQTGSEAEYSWLHFNLDLRIGIAYNWKNVFIGLQAQYNNFTYRKDHSKVNLFDAYARWSLGIRL